MADLPTVLLLAPIIALLAYFVRGVAGFGSALVASPLLALMLPLTVVVPLVVILDNTSSLMQARRHRVLIAWREVVPLLLCSLAGIALALHVHARLDEALLKRWLGGFVIAFALYQLLPLTPPRAGRIWAAPAGFLGGLVGGLFGTGGPFYVLYLRARQLPKTVMLATMAALFALDGGARILAFAAGGHYGWLHLQLLAVMAPLGALGLYLGGRVHVGLSQAAFQRVISAILLASGLLLLAR